MLYKPSYRGNRRATPGSVETLVRLREHGYRLAIVSDGQIETQAAKAEAIGIRHLVDRIFTSEEGGCCKPNRRIFQFAIEALGASPHMVHMVGDSADSDIKGALDAGLSALLYSPIAQESQRLLFGEEVPVVRHMGQLLEHLGNHQPPIRALFCLLARPAGYRGDWHRFSDGAAPLSAHIKRDCTIPCRKYGPSPWECFREHYGSAMSRLEEMIRAVAKAAMPIDETAIQISYPGQGQGRASVAQPECHFTDRDHSICAEYARLALATDSENEAALRDVAVLL